MYLQMPRLPSQQSRREKRCQGNFYCHPITNPTFFSPSSNYLWLLKPTFLNRGRGIHIFKDLNELEKIINDYATGFEDRGEDKGETQKKEEDGEEELHNDEESSDEAPSNMTNSMPPTLGKTEDNISQAKRKEENSLPKRREPTPSKKASPEKTEPVLEVKPLSDKNT